MVIYPLLQLRAFHNEEASKSYLNAVNAERKKIIKKIRNRKTQIDDYT